MLVMLLAALDQTIVSTALPTITSELGGLDQLSWVVTSYLVASTASTPLWGKVSDLFGRKVVLQIAVLVFLTGSALAGASQNMEQLIATRAIQGLGGGGLMVLVMAAIADVVPPRQRGRYTGLFGAVFAVAMVLGPLLGGFFVEQLTWRWIFFVNLPLGALALVIIGTNVHITPHRERGRVVIDWWGSALMVSGVVLALMVVETGGRTFSWTSWQVLAMGAVSIVLLAWFVVHELRHPEPVVPMRLFSSRVFSVSAGIGFVVGFAMFGAIVYLPLFLQVVQGHSPTEAGLMLLPLMVGLLTTSIISGRLISHTGHYRKYPIIGTALATLGMGMFTQLSVDTPYWQIAMAMLVLGVGLGNVMQVLVIAVQNAVAPADLGAATSGATFFRSIGGSFGTAVLGAVMSAVLASQLVARLGQSFQGGSGGGVMESLSAINGLPPAARLSVLEAFAASLDRVFLVGAPIMALGFLLSWLLPEVPLRTGVTVEDSLTDSAPA